MNEHQVAIGETTCAAKFYGVPVTAGGLARIEISEMTKIALERADTARMAIQIMVRFDLSLSIHCLSACMYVCLSYIIITTVERKLVEGR